MPQAAEGAKGSSWPASKPSFRLSERAYKAYRHLSTNAGLHRLFFFSATPIADSPNSISFAPASRKSTNASKPARIRGLPCGSAPAAAGWYGFGSAITQWVEDAIATTIATRSMFKELAVFATCSRTCTWCGQDDLAIASRYAWLVADVAARAHLQAHAAEHGTTCAAWRDHALMTLPQSAAGALDPEPLRLPRSLNHLQVD